MIKGVAGIYNGRAPMFYQYLILEVPSGSPPKYDVIKFNNARDKIVRIGCEVALEHAHRLIKDSESYPDERIEQLQCTLADSILDFQLEKERDDLAVERDVEE